LLQGTRLEIALSVLHRDYLKQVYPLG